MTIELDGLDEDLWLINPSAFTNTQVFNSPGTWTCPSTTTWVEVVCVGAGGGGGPPTGGAGGGGAVLRKWLAVSSPVPITVGSGGTAGNPGVSGGTSAFGPLSPPVPSSTFQAGGGGGHKLDAPTEGGGGGCNSKPTPNPAIVVPTQGYYGSPGSSTAGGGARGSVCLESPGTTVGIGRGRFGGGGYAPASAAPDNIKAIGIMFGGGYFSPTPTTVNGESNRGGGGGSNGTGGSGCVIVRWRQ